MIRTDNPRPEVRATIYTVRGSKPCRLMIPIDIEQEERYRLNLLANRGPEPCRTDYSTEDT